MNDESQSRTESVSSKLCSNSETVIIIMRKLGQTGRKRRKSRQRQLQMGQVDKADPCADLKRWMVSRASKNELLQTFKLEPFYFSGK